MKDLHSKRTIIFNALSSYGTTMNMIRMEKHNTILQLSSEGFLYSFRRVKSHFKYVNRKEYIISTNESKLPEISALTYDQSGYLFILT